MTDDRRADRRAEDIRMAEAITRMENSITELQGHEHTQLQTTVDQIVDILEGPEIHQLGQPPMRNDGLVDKVAGITKTVHDTNTRVASIEATLGNGGVKIKLPVTAWVAIFIAIIAAIAQVVSAIVQ